jgi:hypothetical protein
MTKTYRLNVNGSERTAVEAYSCGPNSPIHTYVLRGGDRLEQIGQNWHLERKSSAFWEAKPVVTVVAL